MLKVLSLLLLLLLAALQYKAWFSDVGHFAAQDLTQELRAQDERSAQLVAVNAELLAEVVALKTGYAAVESKARRDLGMVKPDEVFYFVPPSAPADSALPTVSPTRSP